MVRCLLRYCATRFALKVPTWRLPARGGVAALVDMDSGGGAFGQAGPSSSDSGRTRTWVWVSWTLV